MLLGGRKRSSERPREGRGPAAPGREHGGVSVHPGSSEDDSQAILREGLGRALPNVIGKENLNCSISQKTRQNINYSFVMLIICP